MNRSRIRRLEERALPKPDPGLRSLVIGKLYCDEAYYLNDNPDRFFSSEDEAIEAWESGHGKLPRGCTVIVRLDFRSAAKSEPL